MGVVPRFSIKVCLALLAVAMRVCVPCVSIDSVAVNEGDDAVLTVSVGGISVTTGGGETVDWSTADDTAVAPGDYVGVSGTITLTAGQTTATITVQTTVNSEVEGTEAFYVVLTNPIGVTFSGAVAPVGVVTIGDVVGGGSNGKSASGQKGSKNGPGGGQKGSKNDGGTKSGNVSNFPMFLPAPFRALR